MENAGPVSPGESPAFAALKPGYARAAHVETSN
jgi:hypothetical protein